MEFKTFKVSKDQIGSCVVVSNLSLQCTKNQVVDFFSFCGQISQIELVASADGATQKAAIQFAKETAARTALLLSSAIIVDSQVVVAPYLPGTEEMKSSTTQASTPQTGITETSTTHASTTQAPPNSEADVFVDAHEHEHATELSQEDKPKLSIIVEIAAKGYIVNDKIYEKAKEFDEQHGVTTQFKYYVNTLKGKGIEINDKYKISQSVQKTLQDFDQKYKVQEKIHQIDEKYHVKEKIDYAATTATSLANKALQTDAGQYVQGVLSKTWTAAKGMNEDAKSKAEREKTKSVTVNIELIIPDDAQKLSPSDAQKHSPSDDAQKRIPNAQEAIPSLDRKEPL